MSWGAVGGAAAGVVGGLLSKSSADSAADAQIEAAMIAAEAFAPYSISSPLGKFNVNQDTKQITTALSPLAQGMLDIYGGEASQGLDAATNERLGILDQLAARGEEEARRYTREGLFAAGNLGTHYGTRQVGEVERAIADARLSRMLEARSMAFNERQGAFGNALGLMQLPNTLGGLAMNRNPAAAVSAMGYQNAALTRSAPYQGFAAGVGQAVGNLPWGDIGSSISSIFSGGSSGAFSSPTSANWDSFAF